MMYKWTMPSQITQIGLNFILLISFSGCGLFNWDPPSEKYLERYSNTANTAILLEFSSEFFRDTVLVVFRDTVLIETANFSDRGEFNTCSESAVEERVNDFRRRNTVIKLIINDSVKKTWTGPPGLMGDSVNSPFNYDSWEINHEDKVVEFTITEADIQ